MSIESDPYAELDRVKAMKPNIRKRITRTTVWCEVGACVVVRTYGRRSGLLVECSSEANIADMRSSRLVVADGDWSKRRAFFLTDEVMDERLTLVCDCANTTERTALIAKIKALDGVVRNASIRAILDD